MSPHAEELPGFYYDPEKNRYFRLLPGHNNHNPLTKDSIQHKAMECKRLRLLEEEEKQNRVCFEKDCNYKLKSSSSDNSISCYGKNKVLEAFCLFHTGMKSSHCKQKIYKDTGTVLRIAVVQQLTCTNLS